jgi:hypothetical protein
MKASHGIGENGRKKVFGKLRELTFWERQMGIGEPSDYSRLSDGTYMEINSRRKFALAKGSTLWFLSL